MIRNTTEGTFPLGTYRVNRVGYGAMRLAGKMVFGPPKDRAAAVQVLREAVREGVNHIDTSDFYGPHITNQIIREALHPYPDDLTIVTKVGASRGADGSWRPALSAKDLERAVHDNLRNLGLDVLPVVNLRLMFSMFGAQEGPIEDPLAVLVDLKRQGLIRHLGLSNATPLQVAEARRMTEIVCVQNMYNFAHRQDDALIDDLAEAGIAYVPFFPTGKLSEQQKNRLNAIAETLSVTPVQLALAWLLQRAPNILLIPGTSSVAHLRENIAAPALDLSGEIMARLEGIAGS